MSYSFFFFFFSISSFFLLFFFFSSFFQKHRTLAYYDYLWNRHRTFDPACTRFTADLSPTLRKEILLHMNRECVLNCDFFRDVSNEYVYKFKFLVVLTINYKFTYIINFFS